MPLDEKALIDAYAPLLVQYPEIPAGSKRVLNSDFPQKAPLLYDYHPRDIRIVLDRSGFHSRWRRGGEASYTASELLDSMEESRYRRDLDLMPSVGLHDREVMWRSYAEIPDRDDGYPRTCYGRVVEGSGVNAGRTIVQYWFPYFYNDFWNAHEMDWESVTTVLWSSMDGSLRPAVAAYSSHLGGSWARWVDLERTGASGGRTPTGTHPVVYVANGSHAHYFFGPARYLVAPQLVVAAARRFRGNKTLIDYTTSWESGDRHLITARAIPEREAWTDEWRWLNQKGRWGSPGGIFDLDFADAAPHGPPKAGDAWDNPFQWIDTVCLAAPTRDQCLVPTLIEPANA